MEAFLYGIGIIVAAGLLILLPTFIRKMRAKPEDDLDRFFSERHSEKDEPEDH